MVESIIWGIVLLFTIGAIVEAWSKARSTLQKTTDSYKSPEALSLEYAGIPLHVCSIESDKLLLQVGAGDVEDIELNLTKIWFTKESIPSEWRNIGAWFKVKSGENNIILYEKVLMYRINDPNPINP